MVESSVGEPRVEQRPTKARYAVLAAVFINVVINYMDRSNISVAASFLSKDLALDSVQMGYLFSAFGLTYAFCQIPGGVLADRLGNRGFYSVCLVLWSLATFFQGFATGFLLLFVLRVCIGIFEAPSYPLNNRIVTAWFPDNERAGAIAVYTSGQFIGLAFLTPALVALEYYLGWRALFYVTGGIGIVWGVVWYWFYRDPRDHGGINSAEMAHIADGGGLPSPDRGKAASCEEFQWQHLWFVLSQRKLWGVYIGQFGLGATLIFFLTWFPKYLKDYKGIDFLESGLAMSIPFLCAFAGILFSGLLSDYLVRHNVNASVARKVPVVAGLLLSTTMIGANYVTDPFWVTFFLSLAFFGNGLASITWVFVSLLAPKELLGLTGGTFNFIGGLSAMIVPAAIGHLVSDGSFAPALVFISSLTLAAAMSYIFLVGSLERIEMPSKA